MKLTGWYRIGIVLFIIWCLVVIGITIYQYNNPSNRSNLFITLVDDTTKPIPPVEAPLAPCVRGYNCEEGDLQYIKPEVRKIFYQKMPVVNYKGVLISIIVPIVVVLLLILSIKWIIRGFKSHSGVNEGRP